MSKNEIASFFPLHYFTIEHEIDLKHALEASI